MDRSASRAVMDIRTDSHLIEDTRTGDRAAFGVLIERYMPMVVHLAQQTVGDPDLANDLAQEAFLEAFLSLDALRNEGRFRSWLYGITLNVCRSYLRSQRRDVYSLEALSGGLYREPADDGPSPEEIAERLVLRNALLKAVGTLSQANRAAVMLVYYEAYSLREAADLLGIPLTALKGRLHKARQHLQARLQTQFEWTGVSQGGEGMIPVKVVDVRRTEILKDSGLPTVSAQVVLYDEVGHRALVIWTGESEGLDIMFGLVDHEMPRPSTPVFIARLLQAAGATIQSVEVNLLKDNTFYANIRVQSGAHVHEIDARPSDALAVAVQVGAPIFVSPEVMEQAGRSIPEGQAPTGAGMVNALKQLERQRQVWESHRAKQKEGLSQEQRKEIVYQELDEVLNDTFASRPQTQSRGS